MPRPRRRWKEFSPAVIGRRFPLPISTHWVPPAGQNLRPCRRLPIGAPRPPLSPFAPSRRNSLVLPVLRNSSPDLPPRGRGTARRRWKEFSRIARPITLRTPSRSPLYNPGCRVATLLVSMGVMGFRRGFKGGSKPSAPCGRLSEAEHPKRKGATLLRPLSAVNRNRAGKGRIVAQALLAISDFCHAFSRTAGAWLQSPNPLGPAERFLGAIGLDIKKYRVSS